MKDDVLVGFWCLLGWTKEKVVALDEGVVAGGTLFPSIPNSIQDIFQCINVWLFNMISVGFRI